MRAAVPCKPGRIEVKTVAAPEPAAGEVLIRVTLAGICGSDYSLYSGHFDVPLPVIPGHEAIGRIEALGSAVSGFEVGQRVTIQPNLACGECVACQAGHPNICQSKIRIGIDRDGVFGEYVTVPASCVWPVPDAMEDKVAAMAEPLAVCVHATSLAPPEPRSRTLIFGAGVIGQLTLQLANLQGAEVTACDLSRQRLELARQVGAAHTIGPDQPLDDYHGAFDLIYETCGAPMAFARAVELAAPKGRIVLIGLAAESHPASTTLIVRRELQIMGSMIYKDEFPEALALLQSGRIQTAPLATGKVDLDGLNDALQNFTSPERIKTLVSID